MRHIFLTFFLSCLISVFAVASASAPAYAAFSLAYQSAP
jgi:hypothetical protein